MEYNRKHGDDASRVIDFEEPSIAAVRCEFKRVQLYEHIDEQIVAEDTFRTWLKSVDGTDAEYKVVYPSKADIPRMNEEAKELNRTKRHEKEEKWEKKRRYC